MSDASEPEDDVELEVVEIKPRKVYAPVAHIDLDYSWCSGLKASYWRKQGTIR